MRKGLMVERLTFARSSSTGGRLQISPSAFMEMRKYAQDTEEAFEAGGVLLGRHIVHTNDIIVDCITVPMQGDQQSRFRFFRSRHQHQKLIDLAWSESGGTSHYLGEWHTHPELCPLPSTLDQLGWQQKISTDQFIEPLFFVIVGTIAVRVWEGRRNHRLILLQRL